MNNVEFNDRLADMWRESRELAGMSQDKVAKALGVSKRTIQNWEAGTASPNFAMALQWFEVIGVPMYPYLMSLLYPKEMAEISNDASEEIIRNALHVYIDELDLFRAKELLYLIHGEHGSSPTGTIDVLNTYLHLPLGMRVCIAENIRTHYQIADCQKWIKDKENVLPAIETLERYITTAKKAVLSGKDSYLRFSEEEL